MTAATVSDIVELWLHAVAGGICGPAWATVVYAASDVVGPELGHFDAATLCTADIDAALLRVEHDGELALDVFVARCVLVEAYRLAELLGVVPANPLVTAQLA